MSKSIRFIIIKYLFGFIIGMFIMPFFNDDITSITNWKKTFILFIIWATICFIEIYFENRKQRKQNEKMG